MDDRVYLTARQAQWVRDHPDWRDEMQAAFDRVFTILDRTTVPRHVEPNRIESYGGVAPLTGEERAAYWARLLAP